MGLQKRRLLGLGLSLIIVVISGILSISQEDRINEKVITSDKSGINKAEELSYTLPPKYEFNLFGLLLKTILALGIITGILYFILKFFFRGRGLFHPGGNIFRIIASCSLAPNKFIQLIEIGHNLLLVGVTESGINLLTQISDKETIDLIKLQASQVQIQDSMNFSQYLRGFLKRFQRSELLDESFGRKITFLKDQGARLKRLEEMIEER